MFLTKLWYVKIRWVNRYDEEWNRDAQVYKRGDIFPKCFPARRQYNMVVSSIDSKIRPCFKFQFCDPRQISSPDFDSLIYYKRTRK